MILTDSFGSREVQVKGGKLICTQVNVNATVPTIFPLPVPAAAEANALKCYVVTPTQPQQPTPPHPATINIDALTQTGENVSVGDPSILCVPADIVQ
jgi:hypothetical protein